MATSKSQVDFFVDAYEKLFDDLCRLYPDDQRSLRKDYTVLRDRVLNEGLSFLTKTLPKLGKSLLRAMETKRLEVPSEFKRSHGNRNIPAFMQASFSRLFDSTGHLAECEADVFKDVYQVLVAAYKLELEYSQSDTKRVIDSFVATEQELTVLHIDREQPLIREAKLLIERVLDGFDPVKRDPRHGPGAVATGEKGERKWRFARLYSNLHQQFPYYDWFVVAGRRCLVDSFRWYKKLERVESGVAKVCLVPKDSRGPRLISCEPLEYQWIQQSLGKSLVEWLEKHPLTKGRINFTDQSINRALALELSKTGRGATLDMKDASDRVSLSLVEALLPERVFKKYAAARTAATRLPDGRILPLVKFAPMGSALCFPVEALCFWALSVASLASVARLPRSVARRYYSGLVYVYGDDIIVKHVTHACTIMTALETVGLKFNRDKCFTTGPFRESCGMDAYKGICVTPLRFRTPWSRKRSDGKAYASYVALANGFATRYPSLSSFLWGELENVYGRIPHGTANSAFPCREEKSWFRAISRNIERGFELRFNATLHRTEIRTKFLKNGTEESTLDGWSRLLRNLVGLGLETSRVVLPDSTQIKTGWRKA